MCSLFLLKLVSFETFCLSSTASCYKSCTKYRYLSVITTSQYKACTKCFPLLLRTTKLAQSTSQYYFVLQSLQRVLPTTTSYYKACTKYFPVLLRTTKLAQSTSQYYWLQNVTKSLVVPTAQRNKQTKKLSRSFSWQLHMSQRVDGSEMWYQNILKLPSSIQLRSC